MKRIIPFYLLFSLAFVGCGDNETSEDGSLNALAGGGNGGSASALGSEPEPGPANEINARITGSDGSTSSLAAPRPSCLRAIRPWSLGVLYGLPQRQRRKLDHIRCERARRCDSGYCEHHKRRRQRYMAHHCFNGRHLRVREDPSPLTNVRRQGK